MLIYISVVSTFLCITFIIALFSISNKSNNKLNDDIRKKRQESKSQQGTVWGGYFKLNSLFIRLPVIRSLTLNLQRSLMIIGEKEHKFLVRKTTIILSGMMVSMTVVVILFYQITSNIIYTMVLLFLIWYISDSYLDYFISKGHTRLLKQMTEFIADVRHKYYEYHVVDDAIYEATAKLDRQSREMSVQGEAIYSVLIASDQEEAMAKYQETAPNPFLKMFVNFSMLTMEFGDNTLNGSSVFLMNLSFLNKNIRLELYKRERLAYALKSMGIIVLIPLFVMSPMKEWAIGNFAPLGKFYKSPLGQYSELLTLLIIILSMILLNKIQNLDRLSRSERNLKWLFRRFSSDMDIQLKKKWLYAIAGFLLATFLIFSIQLEGRRNLEHKVYYDDAFLGVLFTRSKPLG